jgi:bacterioferritin (cytochrome b1)
MATKLASLIVHINDLQEVVEGMLALERRNRESLRQFLTTLHDDDFQHLVTLDYEEKILYLERRFAMYCNGLW